MRIVLQRVKEAKVTVNSSIVGQIASGMLVFLGIGKSDTKKEANQLITKISELRIFEDSEGKMNCSVKDIGGEFLVVSQFTLLGNCSKGRRPSFDGAAEPHKAEELYNYFVETLQERGFSVQTGEFRAMMDVSLVNDGPVTFILDSNAS